MLTLATAAAPGLGGESIGWRGNGSGVHLGVDPPLRWQRVSTAVAGLRFQADPPQGDEPSGQSMADGVIRQWLLLGPVPAQEDGKGTLTDALLAEDHSGLTPAAGQELAGAAWKKLNTETAYIDCHQHFGTYGQVPNQVAYLPWHISSPLVCDGLAYCVNNTGVLTVIDVEKMQVVYEKLLDLDQFQTAHEGPGRGIGISPALAGGRIYLLGDTGSTLVIKPGRRYEQLAKNKIESVFYRYWALRHERFVTAPAFEGRRMFVRGERHLYCLAGE